MHLTLAPGIAADRAAPRGFEFQRIDSLGWEILRPQGWTFFAGRIGDASIYQLRDSRQKGGGIVTDLKITVNPHVQVDQGVSVTQFMQRHYEYLCKKQTLVSPGSIVRQGKLSRLEFIADEHPGAFQRKESAARCSYCFIGCDESDVLVLMTFRCAVGKWPEARAIAEAIYANIDLHPPSDK